MPTKVLLRMLHNLLTRSIIKALSHSALIACGLALFFSGCSKRATATTNAEDATTLRLGNAKHFDIPMPVGFSASTKQTTAAGDYLLYSGKLPQAKVIDFYLHSMEVNGWDVENFSNTSEGLLFCRKPSKSCAISVRPAKETNVHIFVKQQAAS
jgi:hypothetical protein